MPLRLAAARSRFEKSALSLDELGLRMGLSKGICQEIGVAVPEQDERPTTKHASQVCGSRGMLDQITARAITRTSAPDELRPKIVEPTVVK